MNAATMTATGETVAYERISRFRHSVGGQSVEVDRGVDRQAEDAETYAEAAGLQIARHYTDNNRSASAFAKRPREAWEDLLEDIRAGRVSRVLVWVLDRIVRKTSDLDDLLEACRANGVRIVQTASGTEVDPNNPESVLHAKISGAVAEYEAAKTAMRARRQKESAAAKGRPHGGRRRFGYEPGMVEIREDEAELIRDAAARVLAGGAFHALARHYNAGDVPPAGGDVWTGPALRQLLLRPHLAGLRVHRGEVIGRGAWPAILSEDTHTALVHNAKVRAQTKSTNTSGSNARKHLLSGLAKCDECGRGLTVNKGNGAKAAPDAKAYVCRSKGHIWRHVEWVDELVEAAMVERLRRYDVAGVFTEDETGERLTALRESRAVLAGQLAELAEAVESGDLSVRAYMAAAGRLEENAERTDHAIRELEAAAARPARVLAGLTGDNAREAWHELDLGRKRAVIAELAPEVRLRRSGGPGAKRADRDVVIHWR